MKRAVGPKAILCVDGAKAWPGVAKRHLGGASVASANHTRKEYVKVRRGSTRAKKEQE